MGQENDEPNESDLRWNGSEAFSLAPSGDPGDNKPSPQDARTRDLATPVEVEQHSGVKVGQGYESVDVVPECLAR